MAFINTCYYPMYFIIILVLGFCVSNALSRTLDGNNITLSMRDRHERWMATYGRTYKDLAEKEKRFNIFKENVNHIKNFNRAASSNHILYTLGVNEFTDLTEDEFIATYSDSTSTLPLQSMFAGSTTTDFKYANITNVPSSTDWREKGAVTPIQKQKKCSSCWAFASVATVEALQKIKTKNLTPLSVQELVDCDHTNYGCKGGNIMKAFKYIQSYGIVTDHVYPYTGKENECFNPKARKVRISGCELVPPYNEEALLQAVSKQPVAVHVNSFGLKQYKGGIFNARCTNASRHAFAIIGYGTENGEDYWLVKNSWGTRWGEKGFMRIIRGRNMCDLARAPFYPV